MGIRGGIRGREKASTLQLTYASRDRQERKELTTGCSTRGHPPFPAAPRSMHLDSIPPFPNPRSEPGLTSRRGRLWVAEGALFDHSWLPVSQWKHGPRWSRPWVAPFSDLITIPEAAGRDQINFGRCLASRGRRRRPHPRNSAGFGRN
jgi:hypothetical protein